MSRRPRLILAAALAVALVLAGCGGDDESAADSTTPAATEDLSGSITVAAAASLTDAFTEIIEGFEDEYPDADVEATFDSSGTLSDQILQGSGADVFASADETNMAKLTDTDVVTEEPTVIARNQLVIVTKPGNPEGIETLDDLADVGVVALCAEDAPCGRFAGQVLEGADVEIPESSVTRGQNVRTTLTAVTEGDAVAGIVYVTDAAAAGDAVSTVEIPEDENAVAVYPIGVISGSLERDLADAFVAYVASDEGQAVLAEYGFLPPA